MQETQIVNNNSKEIVGLFSIAITCIVFWVRGMWYFYYYGYFKIFNIDESYLWVEYDMSLYSVVGLIGIAILLFFLNYWTYELLRNKKYLVFIGTLFSEIIMLFLIIYGISNIGDKDLFECMRNASWQELGHLSWSCFLCVLLLNIFGLVFHFIFNIPTEKKDQGMDFSFVCIIDKLKERDKQITNRILKLVIFSIITSVVLGITVFFTGVCDAKAKKDFRIIEETYIPRDNEVDEKYLFKEENQTTKQYYVVLYETVDKYVIASLALENDVIVKDINRQKVISKENINTLYCSDIENFFEIEEKQNDEENFDTEKISEERGKESSMGEVFVGAFIGALFTGMVNIFVERYKQKKEEKKQESHAASILLYDLKSIEKYLVEERSSVNLRYSIDWQGMVASCSFLKSEQIQFIYEIYDQTYNYNYYYNLKGKDGKVSFGKEEVPQYDKLKKMLFDNGITSDKEKNYSSKYEEIQNELRKHI